MLDWSKIDQMLGTIPDIDIAKIAGCNRDVIYRRRKKLGITRCPDSYSENSVSNGQQIDYSSVLHMFGYFNDKEIADVLRCTPNAIQNYRKRHGIPAVVQGRPPKP